LGEKVVEKNIFRCVFSAISLFYDSSSSTLSTTKIYDFFIKRFSYFI